PPPPPAAPPADEGADAFADLGRELAGGAPPPPVETDDGAQVEPFDLAAVADPEPALPRRAESDAGAPGAEFAGPAEQDTLLAAVPAGSVASIESTEAPEAAMPATAGTTGGAPREAEVEAVPVPEPAARAATAPEAHGAAPPAEHAGGGERPVADQAAAAAR